MPEFSASTRRGHAVHIPADRVSLDGELSIPSKATGLVVFAHGSGSSRLSPRNRFVASILNQAGLGTLLFDLLTPDEETLDTGSRGYRFNIGLLADRLAHATQWALQQPETQELPIGYFGASTGAAAALMAVVRFPEQVGAVVSRGGRPDLAGTALHNVTVPTLLIVGSHDPEVVHLNQQALRQLHGPKELYTVAGATHLFEEPGTLEEVAKTAQQWFLQYLKPPTNVAF
jgi:pimeloyl-ACP methyl ester carboxylesterase